MNPENQEFSIRPAVPDDTALILHFIRELATYEKLAHEVVADEATLKRSLFGPRPYAEAVIGELDGEPVAFALFFHNFSTFLGRPGLYLEDLYVSPQSRGLGLGRALLAHLAKIALERDCGRLEWWVLDWNEKAIQFYESLDAKAMREWVPFRLTGDALENLAAQASGQDTG